MVKKSPLKSIVKKSPKRKSMVKKASPIRSILKTSPKRTSRKKKSPTKLVQFNPIVVIDSL